MFPITVKHSFNAGDLMTILPGFRQLCMDTGRPIRLYQRVDMPAAYYEGAVYATLDKYSEAVCMNEEMFKMLCPLIEAQEYIESFCEWRGEPVDYDLDRFRHHDSIPLPYHDMHHWPFLAFPELHCDLSVPWITAPLSESVYEAIGGRIIVNRTERYTNPYISYFFLKAHEEELIFAGTQREYQRFCDEFKLSMPRLKVHSFLELAQALEACDLFIGNQSFPFHLAEAMKVSRLVEVSPIAPNTIPHGDGGLSFATQEGFEYIFNRFLKERL